MGEAWHTLPPEEALERLGVEPEAGLSEEEAARRLAEHGANELAEEEGPGPLRILWRQLAEPLVLVLVVAAAVSAVLWWLGAGGEREPLPYDTLVILAIVVLNAVLGFVQEYRAERAVESLKEMAAPESRVRRDGRSREIPSRELVPGDVLVLEAGDRVAADARVIESHNLKADEAALTGESVPVSKRTAALDDPETELGDRASMVYTGSVVTYGRGEAVVTATGMETEMGGIAGLLRTTTDEKTPLQEELAKVGRQLGLLVLGICAVVAVAGVVREGRLTAEVLVDMFLFGVALAVAAIPEGLPAVVTAVLALGVRRMAEENAVVRRLPAVETLGSATVIASDKTGTLTRNEMRVRRVLLGEDRRFEADDSLDDPGIERLLRFAVLNNDAEPAQRENDREDGRSDYEGDPTEVGLLRAAVEAGLDPDEVRREHPRRGEVPFSSERKRMTTVHEVEGEPTAVVKGAPEVVLELCTKIRRPSTGEGREEGGGGPEGRGEAVDLDDSTRRAILEASESFAEDALRTLAFASRALPDDLASRLADADEGGEDVEPDEVERELVWEGLVGLIDPPRDGAAESVERARRAGIRSILVTGDHVATGLAIAREVGIAGEGDRALSGRELEELSDDELREAVREVPVYGRVRPEHKIRIVRTLEDLGEVVAMTGDGVNDAPALKEADIGVAMGIAGTDVSKEASDMVLSDDDYSTIVRAVAEGRRIFDNIRKFIRYLLSSNAGEVLTMFGGILGAGALGLQTDDGGFFLPLLAVQILWINLVTDGAPALALGVDPGEPGLMERPPRAPGEPVIDRAMWWMIGLVGLVMMAGTLFVLDAYLPGGLVAPLVPDATIVHARTAAFTALVLFQMVNVFNCLSATESLFRLGPFRNRWLLGAVALSLGLHALVVYWPPLQTAFDTTALTGFDWLLTTGVALTALLAAEAAKALLRRTGA